jgi:hypothetical protein
LAEVDSLRSEEATFCCHGRGELTAVTRLQIPVHQALETVPRLPVAKGLQQDWDLWHAMRGDRAAGIERLKPLGRTG